MKTRLAALLFLGFLGAGLTPTPTPPPAVESVPPPSSGLYIALPRYSPKDPWKTIIPQGPLWAAERDLAERRAATTLATTCAKVTSAGMEATRDKNFKSAEVFFRRVIEGDCDDGYAGLYLAAIYEEQGRFPEAFALLPKVIEQLTANYPNHRYNAFAAAQRGRLLFRLQRYFEAAPILETTVSIYPDDLPHLFFAGVAQCKSGAADKGFPHLKRVIDLADQTPNAKNIASEAYIALSDQSFAEGQFVMCRNYVLAGLRRDPGNKRLQEKLVQVEAAIKNADHQRRYKGMWGTF